MATNFLNDVGLEVFQGGFVRVPPRQILKAFREAETGEPAALVHRLPLPWPSLQLLDGLEDAAGKWSRQSYRRPQARRLLAPAYFVR